MALTVGELNGVITIDDRAMNPSLRRAENALRQAGQQMGDDAQRAGQQAGQNLGQGLVRGADGRWRNMRGELVDAVTAAAADAEAAAHRAGQGIGDGVVQGADGRFRNARGQFVTAGRRAGDAVGDGLSDGASDGADDAVETTGSRLEKLKTVAGGAAAAAGAVAGALLVAGITEALDQSRIVGRLGAQMGKTPAEAQRYGKIAGALYADAVTEDFQGAADAISAVMRAGIAPPDATNAQIKSITANVSDLATSFELDLGQTANAVGQMIKTGLAKNGREAVDALTVGLQKMGPRADDIADTFNEYSTIFRQMGIDATTATGLFSQGMKAGARDTDVVADALKEFTLITQGGGEKVDEAFAKIGLSGKAMQKAFIKGGPPAAKALDEVFDRLRKIKDPAERNAVALTLFATKSEDTQKALMALDPSKATAALGDVGGAADKLGNTLRDNAGTKLEQFKRGMQQNLVNFLGGTVVPAVLKSRGIIGRALGGIWDEAGKDGTKGVDRAVAFMEVLGTRLAQKAVEQAPKLISGLVGLGAKAAEFIASNPMQIFKIALIGAALATALVALPALVAAAISAAVVSIVVGFVSKLVSAMNDNLPKWWASFTSWVSAKAASAGTWMAGLGSAIGAWFSGLWSKYVSGPVSRQWSSFIATVKSLPGRVVAALAPLAARLGATAVTAWQRFRDATVAKAAAFIGWVRGLPGRIVSGLGNLAGLLIGKGRNLVQGFWTGVSGMTGWIKSKLYGWAKSAIPGPIAKALGIASPSKVTTAQGRWIARGLIDGLTGSTKQIKAASGKLSDIIADSLAPGRKRSKALGTLSAGSKKLLALASTEEKVAGRLKAAQKKYADLIKARDALAADVKKGVLEGANITQQSGSEGDSAESILDGLRANRAAADRFAANLAKLRKKGVRSDLIAQIAQAGVAQGSSAAASLANASAAQVKSINKEQAALVTAAGRAGTTAGDAMYGAGIQAASGLVRGLQSQQKAIEKQMLTIAKAMSKSIRAALGIKSPSRVMAAVGAYTAEGLRQGIESGRTAVNRSMSSLVETPAPGSWAMNASAQGTGRSKPARTVTLTGGDEFGRFAVGRLRKQIDNLGGDVQFALGSGR